MNQQRNNRVTLEGLVKGSQHKRIRMTEENTHTRCIKIYTGSLREMRGPPTTVVMTEQ